VKVDDQAEAADVQAEADSVEASPIESWDLTKTKMERFRKKKLRNI
jgi:hypothetical protein